MNQTARIEMWTCLANEAAAIVRALKAAAADPTYALVRAAEVRMAGARGLSRGLDFQRLPFPAWETGRHFLWLLDQVIGEGRPAEARLEHGADLVAIAARLIDVLATSAHRPRADLD